MKTHNKSFVLSLIFSSLLFIGFAPDAQADCTTKNCIMEKELAASGDTTVADPAGDDEFDFDFSEPFFFSDKVTINVYGEADVLLYSGTFTKEEMQASTELKNWLKKSEFLLSIDNQHYYYAKK